MQYGPGMHLKDIMKILMFIPGLFLCLLCKGQELRAFRQEVVGGAVKAFAGQDDTEQVSGNRKTVTYIYLVREKLPRIKALWIDGYAYTFTVSEVQSPVLLQKQFSLTAAKDTLVPATSARVARIIPGAKPGPLNKKGHRGISLIIRGGKISTTEIRVLEPWYDQ
jgi:hypothetical protein